MTVEWYIDRWECDTNKNPAEKLTEIQCEFKVIILLNGLPIPTQTTNTEWPLCTAQYMQFFFGSLRQKLATFIKMSFSHIF